MILSTGSVSPKKSYFSTRNEMRSGMVFDTMLRADETTQIHGFVLIFDMSNFSVKHMTHFAPDVTKKKLQIFQVLSHIHFQDLRVNYVLLDRFSDFIAIYVVNSM